MALLRRRTSLDAEPYVSRQSVLLTYEVGARKVDLDRFTQVSAVLDARLRRLGIGVCAARSSTELVLTGSDCAALWATAERPVLVCPLAPVAVELDSGGPTTRFPVPEPLEVALRARLELATSSAVPTRRFDAFDVLHALELLAEGDWLTLTDLTTSAVLRARRVEPSAWVVDRTRCTSTDEAYDRLLDWSS